MPDPIEDALEQLWREMTVLSPQEALARISSYRPVLTRFEIRAEETTRVAREATEVAAEERQAKTARLRQARLKKEAEEARTASLPPERKGR